MQMRALIGDRRARDAAMVVVSAWVAVGLTLARAPGLADSPQWWWTDLSGGVVASVLLLAHRCWLVPVAFGIVAIAAVVTTTGAAAGFAVLLVALRHPLPTAATVAALQVGATLVQVGIRMREPDITSVLRTLLVAGVLTGVLLACGVTLRLRRQLTMSLAERAERAEEAARRAERTRIAREMHDVLAHRISMMSMHAGSLTYRESLPADELREGLEVINTSARTALDDLHAMLRVLRDPAEPVSEAGRDDQHPQPTLADLQRLVASMREAGVAVEFRCELTQPEHVPELVGRTVHRVAQEALTNAAKHAPGCPVVVTLTGRPGGNAQLTVSNTLASRPLDGEPPGARSGLIGIRERVGLAGGTVTACGPDRMSSPPQFLLEVQLPWPR